MWLNVVCAVKVLNVLKFMCCESCMCSLCSVFGLIMRAGGSGGGDVWQWKLWNLGVIFMQINECSRAVVSIN